MRQALKVTNLAILFLIFSLAANTQIPNGSWRDHFSYRNATTLAITKNKVFCGMNTGGMLSYQKNDGEIEKHSKVTGLSEIDISALAYSESSDVLIVGYSSGNIDLIRTDSFINLPDIKRKSFTASKRINNIKAYGNFAYIACDFGIVVLDLLKNEVKESYFFGPGGTNIEVNDISIINNYLYAATSQGLYKVDLNSPNLLDHSFWSIESGIPGSNTKYKIVETFEDKLFTVHEELNTSHNQIMYFENSSWNNFVYSSDTVINNIYTHNNQLYISSNNGAGIYDAQLSLVNKLDIEKAQQVLTDTDGTIYCASSALGFLKYSGGQLNSIKVKGPLFNPVGKVSTKEDHVWVTSGGPNQLYVAGGGYNFHNENWLSLISEWGGGLHDVGNFYKIAYHPTNINHIYASALRYGLFEIQDYKVTKEHRLANTPIFNSTIAPVVDVRIVGLDFDRKGNLWTIFNETDQPVYILRNGEEWENPKLHSAIFGNNQNFTDLLVTELNQVWILSKRKGLTVLQEQSDGTILEKSFTIKNQDKEAITLGNCLAEDKNGYVWVGTNKGPIFYPPIPDIFDRGDIIGNSVKIPRNDGTGLADYLLDYEVVNDIAIDGGNRKWIATENSGIFLVSSDGLKTLHQFTYDNSRLISNNIIGLGIQEKTGEVFISTNKGLLSFMGTATEGLEDFKDVYVYPNPIRPGYNGDITITGLIENANVKITDVSGNIVYETTSLGGQAIWDGKNFDGNKVKTGVYLVFMTNDDGSKTHITKMVFIN